MKIVCLTFGLSIFLTNLLPVYAINNSRDILQRILFLKQRLNFVVVEKNEFPNSGEKIIQNEREAEIEETFEKRKDLKVIVLFHDDGDSIIEKKSPQKINENTPKKTKKTKKMKNLTNSLENKSEIKFASFTP